ncbi:MAG: hypothetical protein M1834_003088 [Cirrosporium novae-zelandiae]|nr:MAG: hypothetical protein M1834_003088 [Cirrosporium novae-zelandiae]
MPWRPLPRIAFAVAIYPFQPSSPADLPLELGDELYIIEQGGADGSWYRGYLVAQPSLLAGLTTTKGQTLEARVFSGIFPRCCVEVREILGEAAPQTPARTSVQQSGDFFSGLENGFINGILASPASGSLSIRDSQEVRPNTSRTCSLIRRPSSKQQRPSSSRSESKSGRWESLTRSEEEKRQSHVSRRSAISQKTVLTALPLTPVSMSPRDPNAPKPPAPVPMLKIGDETPTSTSEPLVDEIASCLREWYSKHLHELLLSRQYSVINRVSDLIQTLDLSRRQLLHNVLTARERNILRESSVWNLVRGNKMLGGEVVVRDPAQRGRLLTADDSAVELMKLQAMMSLLENNPTPHVDPVNLHHLLVDVKGVVGSKPGPTTLSLYLCVKDSDGSVKPISECYTMDGPSQGSLSSLSKTSKARTMFKDLSSLDINEGSLAGLGLYLIVKVQISQPPKLSLQTNSKPTLTREGTVVSRSKSEREGHTPGSAKNGRRRLPWGHKAAIVEASPPNNQQTTTSPPVTGGSGKSKDEQVNTPPMALKDAASVSRTVGIGALEISSLMRQDKDTEHIVNIWSPSIQEQDPAEDVDPIIGQLLASPSKGYTKSERADRVQLRLQPFTGPDVADIIRKTPTLLQGVTQTRKMGFSGAPTQPRSDIYLTISEAFLPQNAVLSHPTTGAVPLPLNLGYQNLQLTLEVRKSTGERLPRCIFPSSNSTGQTAWRTTAVEKGELWNQTIRLQIPKEDLPGSHLIMSIADAPGFPFALGWIPLWDQNAFIRDGEHSLLLYQYDKTTSSTDNGKGAYLNLPWSSRQKSLDQSMTFPSAHLRLQTYLCSTEFSQEPVLLGLLKWREKSAEQVLELLNRVAFVPEVEIVKLLDDVLDALFSILVAHAGEDEFEDLVFSCLITVFSLVHYRRFNLSPLLNDYIEHRFDFPFANPCLMRSYHRLLSNATGSQTSRSLRATFKVGDYVLKFIMKSREQQKVKEADIGVTKTQKTFYHDLRTIFEGLQALMKNSALVLVGSKTLIVQHFHNWLPALSGTFEPEEIFRTATSFVNACEGVTGKLILYKLVLIQSLLQLDVFLQEPVRTKLVEKTVQWLAPYWESTEVNQQWHSQVRLCCAVVSVLVEDDNVDISKHLPYIVNAYCTINEAGMTEKESFSLLFSKTFPFTTKPLATSARFDEALIELSALLAAFSKRSTGFQVLSTHPDLEHFLSQSLRAHRSIISCEAYPRKWLSAYIYHHRSSLKNLESIASILIESFLPAPDDAENFNTDLWRDFFTTLLQLVSSDTLALETFPEQKRRVVWKIGGDVREQGAELLKRTWEAIGWETSPEDRAHFGLLKMGGFQVQYVPSLVCPILELCLSVHEGLRHVAVEVLQSMVVSEWTLSEDLSVIEAAIIDGLDQIFKTKHLSESVLQKLFITELLDLFEPLSTTEDDALWTALTQMVDTLDELLDLMVAVHGNESSEAFQIMHTLRLMEFLKDMQKEDIFIRYVHQLAELQIQARNPTEAGLALRLHAELYEWDVNQILPALPDSLMPEQSAFDRKEGLYFRMIQLFEDGKSWENALMSYKELAKQYENHVFDFGKLARTQRAMAKIYEGISKEDIRIPKYFRVVFRGLGFPTGLRDKQYIFEGLPGERLGTFTDRMQQQYPAAQIVPAGDIDDVEGQFLQIFNVSPLRDTNHIIYRRARVPHSVREYLVMSQPRKFATTSHRQVNSPDVRDHWVTKTVYETMEAFPTILRKSEVVEIGEMQLTPLQTAVERVWRKNQELAALERHATEGDADVESYSALVDAIKSSVESTSIASVSRYRAFLPPEDAENEDEYAEPIKPAPLEESLKVALVDHAATVSRSLNLLSRSSYQAIQQDLKRDFEITFAPELEALSPVQPPTTPPRVFAPSSPVETTRSPPATAETVTSQPFSPEPVSHTRQSSRQENKHPNHGHRLSLSFLKRTQTNHSDTKGIDVPETQVEEGYAPSEAPTTHSSNTRSERKRSILNFRSSEDHHRFMPERPSQDQMSEVDSKISFNEARPVTSDTFSSGKKVVVKKRLSMFNIGKKKSTPSVKVESVLEE